MKCEERNGRRRALQKTDRQAKSGVTVSCCGWSNGVSREDGRIEMAGRVAPGEAGAATLKLARAAEPPPQGRRQSEGH